MKIALDILHPAHANLFKNLIDILLEKGFEVDIIYRKRGVLEEILNDLYPKINLIHIGDHYGHLFGKIFGSFTRVLKIFQYINQSKPDICLSNGWFLSFGSIFVGTPSITIIDDFEYKLTYYLGKSFATVCLIPSSIKDTGHNLTHFSGFKELAYLSPKFFKPNEAELRKYNVKPMHYVFVRLVSNISLNYSDNTDPILTHKEFSLLEKYNYKIILSLEDKSQKKIFKDKCLILEEPVNDIHSLMHFAAITISSGDSMARESCLVGTPSIYTGGRYMDVNEPLIRNGFMKSVASKEELKTAIVDSLSGNFSEEVSLQIKKAIKSDWSDTTKIMEDCVTELIETTKSLEGNQ